jgi:hypothetical protein
MVWYGMIQYWNRSDSDLFENILDIMRMEDGRLTIRVCCSSDCLVIRIVIIVGRRPSSFISILNGDTLNFIVGTTSLSMLDCTSSIGLLENTINRREVSDEDSPFIKKPNTQLCPLSAQLSRY